MAATPADFAAISYGAQGLGALASAAGAYRGAVAQKKGMKASAAIANWEADQVENNAAIEEQNQRLKVGALFGEQRAQLAANGLDLGQGSALDVLRSTKYMGDRDVLQIADNATRRSQVLRMQAGLDDAAAQALSPTGAAATSLIGSAGTVAQSWYQYQKEAAPSTRKTRNGPIDDNG